MIGIIGFVVEGLSIVALVIWSYRDPDRFATFGELLDRVMTTRAARICILTFWWWLGWHFFFAQTVDPAVVG
jgi:multisubunit Na+/H+ antiporter MnhB subunit